MTLPPLPHDPSALAEAVLVGDMRALARALRWIDDRHPQAVDLLKRLYPRTGHAHRFGITGSPGAGKSTLADRLIGRFRGQGMTVGVLAVDPSSPFTGGAILGDRIRMTNHATDPGVFIRSLATRGAMGGLSRSTADSVKVLDAAGKDVILIETVGVGQDEVDIVQLADTTVVVLNPGGGDDIQAMKAGLLEIGDLFVINKADREGADRAVQDIEQMLALKDNMTAAMWMPRVLKTVAATGLGIDALMQAAADHRSWLQSSGEARRRLRGRLESEWRNLLGQALLERALARLATGGGVEPLLAALEARQTDPYTEVERLVAEIWR